MIEKLKSYWPFAAVAVVIIIAIIFLRDEGGVRWGYVVVAGGTAALAAFGYWLKTNDWTTERIRNALVAIGIDPHTYAVFKKNFTTPKGVAIRSTVVNIPQEFLDAVDFSIQRVIRNHTRKYPYWKNGLDLTTWSMCLIDPMTTNKETTPGSPALLVKGYQTAGTVIGAGRRSALKSPMLVIPHQADRGWAYLDYFRQSVYNESEHFFERVNDYLVFESYAHSGDVHEHVGDEAVGLVSSTLNLPCKIIF